MFAQLSETKPDPLYATAAAYAADPRENKMDLSVGVYRDGDGLSPVMDVVKTAERALVREQDTKSYRPLLGDPAFLRGMTQLAFGEDHPLIAAGRVVAVQATGGTGALRIAAALLKAARPNARIHIGTPTWPAHAGVFSSEGIAIEEHVYWHAGSRDTAWDEILSAASSSIAGDAFLLHGPCHNPTGIDLTLDQRRILAAELEGRGAIPVVDAAYYGLADGLDADLELIHAAIDGCTRAIVSMSCSKTFGLYRERTGVLFVVCADADEAARVSARLGLLSRLLVSSAPAHGAEVVGRILEVPAEAAYWRAELESMRQRILTLRDALVASGSPTFASLSAQKGIFAMLPLDAGHVAALAADHGIYMPPSGRANLVGLRDRDIARFVAAVERVRSEAAEMVAQ